MIKSNIIKINNLIFISYLIFGLSNIFKILFKNNLRNKI